MGARAAVKKFSLNLAGAAAVAAAMLAFSPSAEAKQCVWNKAGFILEVHWYNQGDVLYDDKGEFYVRPKPGTGGRTAATPVDGGNPMSIR